MKPPARRLAKGLVVAGEAAPQSLSSSGRSQTGAGDLLSVSHLSQEDPRFDLRSPEDDKKGWAWGLDSVSYPGHCEFQK